MTSPAERRRFKRVEIKVPAVVYFRRGGQMVSSFKAEVLDISEGGMKISAEIPMITIGDQVLVQVEFDEKLMVMVQVHEADKVEFELSEEDAGETVVRWASGQTGTFGVEFRDLKPETRALVKRIVERLSSSQPVPSKD